MADAITVPQITTRAQKGSELSAPELDANFTTLRSAIIAALGIVSTSLKTDGTPKDDTIGQNALKDRVVGPSELALANQFVLADTGAANQYQIALSPVAAAYVDGLLVFVKARNGNTGPSTLRVDALAHTKILKQGSLELAAGDIPAGSFFAAIYWTTNSVGAFHFLGTIAGSSGGGGTSSTLSGIVKYEPPDVALPGANLTATFGHGFGVYPNKVQAYLVNISTEHGYALSDRVPLDAFYIVGGEPAFTVDINASSIVVTQHSATIKVTKGSDASQQTITVGNWHLVVTAEQFTNVSTNTFPDLNLQVANPDGCLSYGQEVFFWHHGRHDNKLYLTRWNLATGVLNWVETFSTENFGMNVATFRYPSDSVDRVVMTSNDGTDGKINHMLLQSPYTRPATLKSVAGDASPHAYKAIWVDDSGGASATNPTLYFAYSNYNAAILTNAIPAKKIVYSGGYGAWTTHGISLNLHHASIANVAAFTKYHTAGANILLFQYNPINAKRRIYLISTATGFLHIFNLLNNTTSNATNTNALNANIAAWWPTASGAAETTQMAMLTYEKSLPLAGLGLGWVIPSREKFCIEYDHSTGQEISIVMGRTGSTDQTGTIVRVPWKE